MGNTSSLQEQDRGSWPVELHLVPRDPNFALNWPLIKVSEHGLRSLGTAVSVFFKQELD